MSFRLVFGSFLLGVSTAFTFYEIGLWARRPTPSLAGRPMVCFFVGFLTANLPGTGDPSSSYAIANVDWRIVEIHKTRRPPHSPATPR